MAHTEHSLLKLSKDDLARLVFDYQGKSNSVLQSLKDDVSEIKSKFTVLESELQVSKNVADNLTKYIKTLECKCHENQQYSRKECLEISGIPSSNEDSALQDPVLKLFSKVDVLIDPSNVEDCHRLKSSNNAPQKFIIKLSKRKDVYHVLKAKSSFKNADVTKNGIPPNTAIFVNQSLCRYYKFLWSKCKILWLNKIIESFLASKGLCRIRLIDNSVKLSDIEHLKSLFPGHEILEENAVSS